jgi:tripartite-type tricarboxylate transporter receptor subunit TctC
VPAAVPAPLVTKLAEALQAGVAAPEVQDRYKALGIESAPLSPAEFQAFVARENAEWRPLIRELGIRLDG